MIKMKIHGRFKFHNVGQGLFYSGRLENTNDPENPEFFSFVYDCGAVPSTDSLTSEIDSFKNSLPSPGSSGEKTLNLLVISHLHDDHVNGLERLLDGVKVDTVVMPYLNEGLKSLPLLESTEEDKFLSELYNDEVAWFASRGVRRIIRLVAEDMRFENEADHIDQSIIADESEIEVESERVLRTERSNGISIIYLKSHSTAKCSRFCWEFHFENLKLDSVWIDIYKRIVRDHSDKHGSLEKILKSKLLTKALMKDIRKTPCKDILNRTSVILLHCPEEKVATAWFGCCKRHLCSYCMTKCGEHSFCNSVLTGDVALENGEHFEILDEALARHESYVLQFPHHGAKNDRNIDYFSAFHANATVLSYGIGNKYKHPRTEVVYRLDRPVLVNEKQSFEYRIFVRR